MDEGDDLEDSVLSTPVVATAEGARVPCRRGRLQKAKLLTGVILVLVAAACTGTPSALSTRPVTRTPSTFFPQLVDVGGYSLNIDCRGLVGSRPTVVLDAGFGVDSTTWSSVVPYIAMFTRVCVYDRAGLGASDARPASMDPFSSLTVAHELHSLLQGAGLAPPYVLVGHSIAGEYARTFAALYPAEVSGVVFVDSASPEQHRGRFGAWARRQDPNPTEAGVPFDFISTDRILGAAGDLGSIPLIVLTHGRKFLPAWAEKEWTRFQANLAKLSTDSVHVVALRSGHFIQMDQPALVAAAIREVVMATSTGSLPPCGIDLTNEGATCLPIKRGP